MKILVVGGGGREHAIIKKLKENNIFTVVHIINGLPYETKEMMIETVKYLNNLQ